MATGTVKWFSKEKGIGFIRPDDGGADLFAHHSRIERSGGSSLRAGARVAFDAPDGARTRAAANIRLA
jgi:CspA family cold shock protein